MTFWSWVRSTLRADAPRPRGRTARIFLGLEGLEERLALSNSPLLDPAYLAWRNESFSIGEVSLAYPIEQSFQIDPQILADGNFSTQASGFENLIGLNQVNANYNYKGQGYTVAVIDTGIDYRHTALGGGWGVRVVDGWDFVNNDADPLDDNGHGTHVAGIIGSSNATYPGVAPNVNLVALKVLGADGSGSFGYVEDALRWVINNQAKYNIVAINLSLGAGNYTSNPYTFLEDEFTTLKSQGVFIASASGNSFYSYSSAQGLGYPAISPNTVSVGAVWSGNFGSITWASGAKDVTTAADRITSFTQRSAGLDIFAPGALITSTYLNGGYQSMAGTSMATPVVAGAAVLIHQALDNNGQAASANQNNILSIMKSTGATVIDGDDENDNVTNTGLSFKRLDVYAAIQSITRVNQAPTLASVANQYLGNAALVVTLNGSDADGDALTYSARVVGSQNSLAYTLDQQLALTYSGSYYTNTWGLQEKWMLGNSSTWYIILPNGELRKWAGSVNATLLATNLMGTLGAEYYQDPSLLWNAQPSSNLPVSLSVSGNNLTISKTGSIASSFTVEVTVSDGKASAVRTFTVTPNNAPTLTNAIGNQSLAAAQTYQTDLDNHFSDADGTALSFSVQVASYTGLRDLDQALGLSLSGATAQPSDPINPTAKWVYSNVQSNWYQIRSDGRMYYWSTPHNQGFHNGVTLPSFVFANPSALTDPLTPPAGGSLSATLGAGNVLTIQSSAGVSGIFQVTVSASDSIQGASTTFFVSVTPKTLTAGAVVDQTMDHRQDTLVVALGTSGAAGNPNALSYQVSVTSYGGLTAYDQALGLSLTGPTEAPTDSANPSAKWVYSAVQSNWYQIRYDGRMFYWSTQYRQGFHNGVVLPTFVYNDPSLLTNPTAAPNASLIQTSINTATAELTINPPHAFEGVVQVTVLVSEGASTVTRSFYLNVSNNPTSLGAIADQSMSHGTAYRDVALNVTDADRSPVSGLNADTISYEVSVTAYTGLRDLNQALGFTLKGPTAQPTDSANPTAKWVYSAVQSNWYQIRPDGRVYYWSTQHKQGFHNGVTLPTFVYNDPSLLTNAATPPNASLVQTSIVNGALRLDPPSTFVGVVQVTVTATDGMSRSTRTFLYNVTNQSPVLNDASSSTTPTTVPSNTLDLNSVFSDPDGDSLTFGFSMSAYTALRDFDNLLGLEQRSGNPSDPSNPSAKWVYSASQANWYQIRSDGRMYYWSTPHSQGFHNGVTFPAFVYADTTLLTDGVFADMGKVTMSQSNGVVTLGAPTGFRGIVQLNAAASDGIASTPGTFLFNLSSASGSASAAFESPAPGFAASETQVPEIVVSENSGLGAADVAAALDRDLGLSSGGNYYDNRLGLQEKWLQTRDGGSVYVLPNGEVRRGEDVSLNTATSTDALLAVLDAEYWANPELLWNAWL